MDLACDHIQEEFLLSNDSAKNTEGDSNNNNTPQPDLNTEIQETFRAFSASPWGVRIGGLWDNVRKQGESYYEGARQEYVAASEEAAKGFSGLRDSIVDRTRNLSLSNPLTGEEGEKQKEKDEAPTPKAEGETGTETEKERNADTSAGTGEGFLSRFKAEAAKRLKEFEKAEDAADEALLRFGLNVRQKLRDAISIIPPETEESKVLFESKDAEGKRVIHATRFEAQLHVIHANLENFLHDPASEQWPVFKAEFNVGAKTDAIAADLDTYPELRAAMEKLVPEKVEYGDFWARYYFLRLVIETEEQKRKELVKGMFVSYIISSSGFPSNKRHRRECGRRRSSLGRRLRLRIRLSINSPRQVQGRILGHPETR